MALGPPAASAEKADSAVDQSIRTLLGEPKAYTELIARVQRSVAAGDAQSLSTLVRYPLVVTVAGQKRTLVDARAFVAAYPQFMTPAMRSVISEQKYDELFVNAQGVMFGHGELWINGICDDKACTRSTPRVVAIQPTR